MNARDYSLYKPSKLFSQLNNKQQALWEGEIMKAFSDGYEFAIDDACEWFKENLPYSSKPPCQIIEDFSKAMKGE